MKKRFVMLLFTLLTMFLILPAVASAETTSSTVFIATLFSSVVLKTLGGVLLLIAVDTILGMLLGVASTQFKLELLPKFISTSVALYFGGLIILAMAAPLSTELSVMFYGAVAATTVKFLADIKVKLVSIFGEFTK